MEDNITIGELTKMVEEASSTFEKANTEAKRKYLLRNIYLFKYISKKILVGKGSFGTGYPFYALNTNLGGEIPIIQEQIRYNRELIIDGNRVQQSIWQCKRCLDENLDNMPDLKSICKPCPKVIKMMKPRKVINRLPDIDMWLVCEDGRASEAEIELQKYLTYYCLKTSDIDPIGAIENVSQIAILLKYGYQSIINLPIDAHIVEYGQLKELIEGVPAVLEDSKKNGEIPYLPIHPRSFRKTWQYDDTAYNYIYDFLSAFTEFYFPEELQHSLNNSRREIATRFTPNELLDFLKKSATKSNYRRFQEESLERIFLEKIKKWKQLRIEDNRMDFDDLQ